MAFSWLIFCAGRRAPSFNFSLNLSAALVVLLISILPIAHAGRPMAIDDATVTNTKGCELETWVQKSRSDTEYWLLPNCNVNGNLELTLGAARIVSSDRTQTMVVMQGKTLLKLLEANGWGAGLVVGNADQSSERQKSAAKCI